MIEDLKAIGKTPLSEKVYSTLVESIVKGTLPPGPNSRNSTWPNSWLSAPHRCGKHSDAWNGTVSLKAFLTAALW